MFYVIGFSLHFYFHRKTFPSFCFIESKLGRAPVLFIFFCVSCSKINIFYSYHITWKPTGDSCFNWRQASVPKITRMCFLSSSMAGININKIAGTYDAKTEQTQQTLFVRNMRMHSTKSLTEPWSLSSRKGLESGRQNFSFRVVRSFWTHSASESLDRTIFGEPSSEIHEDYTCQRPLLLPLFALIPSNPRASCRRSGWRN